MGCTEIYNGWLTLVRGVISMSNPSLKKIISCLDRKQSFILEAAAGSGKTWTLIESLKYLLVRNERELKKRKQGIACITFTNIAKNEISKRIDFNPLVLVYTIHEYLWSVIKHYPNELKREIFELNAASKEPIKDLEVVLRNTTLIYSQYGSNYAEGRLFHEDIIKLSKALFSKYLKISKIVSSQYPFIFIDEYQDTEKAVVELLLDGLLMNNIGKITLGFFGDSMQTIYNNGNGKIESPLLETVTKEENYRCSKEVISLLNKVRINLTQFPAGTNLNGSVSFYHCNGSQNNDVNLKTVQRHLTEIQGWAEISKILMLTHKNIANNLNYGQLIAAYELKGRFGRDRLYNRDEVFANFMLGKIEYLSTLHGQADYGELVSFLGTESCKLAKHSDKEKFQTRMTELNHLRQNGTIKDVLDFVFTDFLAKPKRIKEFEFSISQDVLDEHSQKNKKFYDALMQVPYIEVTRLHDFIQESTPFSTKHGVKGAEFDNVLIVIDDSSWNQYKFDAVFAGDTSKSQYERSLNLFYVCCSRAKNNLSVLFLSDLSSKALGTANLWFQNRIYSVSELTPK